MPEEMFFSFVLRFHRFCGNTSLMQSLKQLTERSAWPGTSLFLRCSDHMLKDMNIEADDFIEKHTAIPFYRMFIPKRKYQCIKKRVLEQPHNILPFLPQRRPWEKQKIENFWYCPVCHALSQNVSEVKLYQQVPGVYVCHKHGCYLKKVSLSNKDILSHPKKWNLNIEETNDKWLLDIAQDVHWILSEKPIISLEDMPDAIWEKVISVFPDESLAYVEDFIRRKLMELPEEYIPYFEDFKLSRFIATPYNKEVSPMEYLIVIRMLFGSFSDFVGFVNEKK